VLLFFPIHLELLFLFPQFPSSATQEILSEQIAMLETKFVARSILFYFTLFLKTNPEVGLLFIFYPD